MYDIGIVGGGAAGLMAAIAAGQAGARVCVIERNSALGRKLRMTGGGRCNLTHYGAIDELVRAYGRCGRFLRHALHTFGPIAVIRFFAEYDLACAVEKDGCVFPAVHRASDICRILHEAGCRVGVRYQFSRRVESVSRIDGGYDLHSARGSIAARTVIIAAGGVSWPQTGSDGDGYRLARELGHTIEPPRASVCPVVAAEPWLGDWQGVTLKNVVLRAKIDGRKIVAHGATVFTANGLGGPAAFDLSREITDILYAGRGPVAVTMDMVPEVSAAELDAELTDQCRVNAKRRAFTILTPRLPRAIAIRLTALIEPSPSLLAGQLKKQQRRQLLGRIKSLPLTLIAVAPLTQATVTRGGVALDEIDPKTMQSRTCPGLFFAGETLDADGPCGGYNLQIAWCTAVLAARSAAQVAVLH